MGNRPSVPNRCRTMRAVLVLSFLMVATQLTCPTHAQPMTGSSPALAAKGRFCPKRASDVAAGMEDVAAGFHADGTVSLIAHGGGDATPIVLGGFNASELVIGLMVAATAADVDGDGVDELVIASATGTGRWDADAVQALSFTENCTGVKVLASSGTVGIGVWEHIAPLERAATPPVATQVVAIQGNAPNASFVVFKFTPPYYMDVVTQTDAGLRLGASAGERLAWATVKYDLVMLQP